MDKLKTQRSTQRAQFTKAVTKLNDEFSTTSIDRVQLRTKFNRLKDIYEKLKEYHQGILDELLDSPGGCTPDVHAAENDTNSTYEDSFAELEVKYQMIMEAQTPTASTGSDTPSFEMTKKKRDLCKATLDGKAMEAEVELQKPDKDMTKLQIWFNDIQEGMVKIESFNEIVINHLLLDPLTPGTDLTDECEETTKFKEKMDKIKIELSQVLYPVQRPSSPGPSEKGDKKKSYQLPKIEFKKFDGDLRQWLPFWAQFQSIDEDEDMDAAEKFQYLIQCMVVNSKAYGVVSSYPQTRENYPKAVEALKRRFGKDKLLKRVYIRELIQLIVQNANSREKVPISTIYDKIESHLRSLESLGVTTGQNDTWLYPMVESCLTAEILRAWERDPLSSKDAAKAKEDSAKDATKEDLPKNDLDSLMEFMRREVEAEEQIKLAHADMGFLSKKVPEPRNQGRSPSNRPWSSRKEDNLPTVAGLHVGEKQKCVFCGKHDDPSNCSFAHRMLLTEKVEKVKERRLCLKCLKPNHHAAKCKSFLKCPICGKRHVVVMCPELPIEKKTPDDKKSGVPAETKKVQFANANLACSSQVILGTLMVPIRTKTGRRRVRGLVDNGAQRSYLLKRKADAFKLKSIGEEEIIHNLFGGISTNASTHRIFNICVDTKDGGTVNITVMDQEVICNSIPRMSKGPWMDELKSQDIWIDDLETDDDEEIVILIGADIYGQLLTGRIFQLSNGLTAVETKLGWTIMGKCNDASSTGMAMHLTSMVVSESPVQQLWDLEAIGIRDPAEVKSKAEKEEETRLHFLKTVTRDEDGRYSVSLPWTDGKQEIPDNRWIAEKYLVSATKKLQREGKVQNYEDVFFAWLNEGIIEEVPEEELNNPSHYLPHRPVFKPESLTTPIRPVFNASCKTDRKPSLNDCLEKGPNLLELIPSIFLRFREGKYGAISDIRKAFLMILIQEQDRDYLRFLWWEDIEKTIFRVYRHKRVVFGVNCSPFLLGAVLQHHLRQVKPENRLIAEKLLQSLYVDNCVVSFDTYEEYEEFKATTTSILAEAKMDLRMWQCSSREVPEVDPLISRGCGLEAAGDGVTLKSASTMVLGLRWNTEEDWLSVHLEDMDIGGKLTKRKILSTVQKIYDPIGFLCPVLLLPKCILQEAWLTKISWDEEVPVALLTRFMKWYKELPSLQDIKIPRNFTDGSTNKDGWSIHTFCDASKKAFAAVIYIRIVDEEKVTVQLLQAKSRVSPIKVTTIPRLELLGCTIGSRLTEVVSKALNYGNVPKYYWSDSTTALSWISRNDEWGTFVGNRVKEIVRLTKAEDWRYVPGTDNPADLPSRGCNAKELLASRWWEGPEWLRQPEEFWPREVPVPDEEEINEEKRKTKITALLSTTKMEDPWYVNSKSSYYTNLRILAWVNRFIYNTHTRKHLSKDLRRHLSVQEINKAELMMVKMVQKECFSKDKDIQAGLRTEKGKDGIIRVKTKILHREDSWGFRYPILLPHSHPMVSQLIMEEHLSHGHSGVQFLMGKLREKVWIVQSRRAIRRVISSCVTCRRYQAKSIKTIPTALPEDRVKDAKAFEVTGVDLFGPLVTKEKIKVWVVLFTCAIFRCIHMELVESLSTEAFLEALGRFMDRRGRPSIIYSDNGTNFVGAVSCFKTINWEKVTRQCGLHQIQWKFNPPKAPWWGGWWERMVRTAKDLLKKIMGKAKVSKHQLINYLVRVEAFINSRPLTTVTEDPEDLTPLTPAMFLCETPIYNNHDIDFMSCRDFQRLHRERKTILDEFRMRFRKEYLGQMVQRQRESKSFQTLKVGMWCSLVTILRNDGSGN